MSCRSMVYGLNLACQSNFFLVQASLQSSPGALTFLRVQKDLCVTKTQLLDIASPSRSLVTEIFLPANNSLLSQCSKMYLCPSLQLQGPPGR